MVRNLEQVPGVIKRENGYRFAKEFTDSLNTPFLLFGIGILRFDKGEFNSYYIMCLNLKAQWGLAKFNKDLSFNSFYVVESPGVENRYDKNGNLVCQYQIEGNKYIKSTDGSEYIVGGEDGFKQGDKQYYYVR